VSHFDAVTKEQIVESGFVHGAWAPVQIFVGWVWSDKPRTKRLCKKVARNPQRYPKYARPVILGPRGVIPPHYKMIEKPWPAILP
jgi:hypothetical protein